MSVGLLPDGRVHLHVNRSWQGALLDLAQRSTIRVGRAASRLQIEIDAAFAGDPPPPGPSGTFEGLWKFEVIELFASADGAPDRYLELELGPYGHTLALLFEGLRTRRPPGEQAGLQETVRSDATIEGTRWRASATVEIPACLQASTWRINAFRAWGSTPRRFALAASLPGSAPDFHQPQNYPAVEPGPPTAAIRAACSASGERHL